MSIPVLMSWCGSYSGPCNICNVSSKKININCIWTGNSVAFIGTLVPVLGKVTVSWIDISGTKTTTVSFSGSFAYLPGGGFTISGPGPSTVSGGAPLSIVSFSATPIWGLTCKAVSAYIG